MKTPASNHSPHPVDAKSPQRPTSKTSVDGNDTAFPRQPPGPSFMM